MCAIWKRDARATEKKRLWATALLWQARGFAHWYWGPIQTFASHIDEAYEKRKCVISTSFICISVVLLTYGGQWVWNREYPPSRTTLHVRRGSENSGFRKPLWKVETLCFDCHPLSPGAWQDWEAQRQPACSLFSCVSSICEVYSRRVV